MLATPVDEPFDDDRWLFEIKWDGFRAIARVTEHGVTLTSRRGIDLLERFGGLAGIGEAFARRPLVVDGEITALDDHGKSSFQALQEGDRPLTFVAFDLLFDGSRDLRAEPLEKRKEILRSLLIDGRGVMYSKHVIGQGKALFALARREDLEGVIGKRRDSPYRERRSADWVKIKTYRTQSCLIGGWTQGRGTREGFGALLLGVYEGKNLVYAGSVGTGFDARLLKEIGRKLEALETERAPFATVPKVREKTRWVRPKLVAEVRFGEWTRDGLLRQPVFLGLRDDVKPRDCVREREKPTREVV
jgi:bifunctional non-homologous end joining protein LigD